jgi:tetratricopeptide (TPR) repeat protein
MKAKILLLCFLIFGFSFSLFSQTGEELIAQGDEIYNQMQDMTAAQEAIAKYRAASGKLENKYEALWRIARMQYYIGAHSESKKEKKKIFAQGIYYAERAVESGPEKPDGYYWLAVNQGKYGEVKGVLKSLSLVKPIKRSLNKIIELDRSYEDGGADRVLGRVYFKVPGIAGGSKKKARIHLEKSLEYGPDDPLTKLYYAESLMKAKEIEKAREILESILNMDDDPRWVSGIAECKVDAAELLEDKKFRKKK